jgi:hypothetical protein
MSIINATNIVKMWNNLICAPLSAPVTKSIGKSTYAHAASRSTPGEEHIAPPALENTMEKDTLLEIWHDGQGDRAFASDFARVYIAIFQPLSISVKQQPPSPPATTG